jgi:NAD(P)H dehydrogenase (quinone)
MMKKFLVIYAHPDPGSFNAAIRQQVVSVLTAAGIPHHVIDLYAEHYNPVLSLEELKGQASAETKRYQQLISDSTDIIFIFPVFWFRAPAILEGFLDKVFVPGFAYRFKQIIGKYGIPIPLLKDKRVLAIVTHGAPALPVKTLYINAVKYRFLLGFLSFCFYLWKCRFIQLWSVPFINAEKREKYLKKVERVVGERIKQ